MKSMKYGPVKGQIFISILFVVLLLELIVLILHSEDSGGLHLIMYCAMLIIFCVAIIFCFGNSLNGWYQYDTDTILKVSFLKKNRKRWLVNQIKNIEIVLNSMLITFADNDGFTVDFYQCGYLDIEAILAFIDNILENGTFSRSDEEREKIIQDVKRSSQKSSRRFMITTFFFIIEAIGFGIFVFYTV